MMLPCPDLDAEAPNGEIKVMVEGYWLIQGSTLAALYKMLVQQKIQGAGVSNEELDLRPAHRKSEELHYLIEWKCISPTGCMSPRR